MRELTIDTVGGPLIVISFPCKHAGCKNEVKVDEKHPDYEHFRKTPIASCGPCFSKRVQDIIGPIPPPVTTD